MTNSVAAPAITAFTIIVVTAAFMFIKDYEQFAYFIVVTGFLIAALGIYKEKA